MKNILFLCISVLVLLAGSVSVKAQGNYPPPRRYPHPRRYPQQQQRQPVNNDFYKPRFGIVAGANIANIIDPNDASFHTDTRVGLNLGVSLDVPIVYPIGFEADLLYSEKGYTAYTPYGQFSQHSNFIDLPLLLKLHVVPNFSFVVGPQLSFLTSTQNVYNNGFSTTVQQQYTQDSEGYNKSLIDGVVGVAINLNRNVELRGRYTIDLQSNTAYTASNNPQYKNQVWQIGLGFKF
jgi:hypothetical protein